MYVATENDTIFAIDADTGAELFRSNLGPAVPKDQLPCPDMGPQIGITGTPVIDPVTHTLYVAAKTFSSGSTSFHLHAIDLASGKEKDGSPVLITATLPGTGTGKRNGTVTFDAATTTTAAWSRAHERTSDHRFWVDVRPRPVSRLAVCV